MINSIYQSLNKKNILQNFINFLFICFIFLYGFKIAGFQFRFLILLLLLPCFFKITNACLKKDFKSIKIIIFFSLIVILHSIVNIFYETENFSNYNIFGILILINIFVISYFFYENFNKNILNIVKLFLIIFFISVLLSFFDFKNDAPFFCGGIPDFFGFLKSYEQYFPDGSLKSLNYLDLSRIGDMKFSFREYIFPENSHLGMVAPGIIIYLIYISFSKNSSKLLKILTFTFIFLCLVKSSTTLLLGTILSLILLISTNFKNIPKNVLIFYLSILSIFLTILVSSKECRSRFVPIYSPTNSVDKLIETREINTVGNINSKFASILKNTLGVNGNLSSGVYFHALMIAKRSILEKPFGWGVNRYDIAFNHFNNKYPSKIKNLNNYNNKDGTNNFVKLTVEIGIFALFFYLFCLLFLFNKKIPIEYKLFYLPFIVSQSLRGAGYFNGGFSLIIFLMLFTYLRFIKKKL